MPLLIEKYFVTLPLTYSAFMEMRKFGNHLYTCRYVLLKMEYGHVEEMK